MVQEHLQGVGQQVDGKTFLEVLVSPLSLVISTYESPLQPSSKGSVR